MNDIIFDDILKERNRQISKWGGIEHDLGHNPRDWCSFIVRHLGRAQQAAEELRDDDYRKQMVRVGALVVAAIEVFDATGSEGNKTHMCEFILDGGPCQICGQTIFDCENDSQARPSTSPKE